MKTLFKLLVISIIVAVVYKYLVENNINVELAFESAINKIEAFSIEVNEKLENKSKNDELVSTSSNYADLSNEVYSQPVQNNYTMEATPIASTIVAKEFPIAQKSSIDPRYQLLDEYATQDSEEYTSNMELLIEWLIKPATNDIEKARVIFTWLTHNILYDDYGYNTGNYGDLSAEGVFKSRKAVCSGFSELFKAMGTLAGLEVEIISGYAKGYGYRSGNSFTRTNHAWNAIKIEGTWRLFDATWAQGSGTTINGQLVSVNEFDEFWFDTDPHAFIFSHLPENQEWQLIENPITLNEYESLPYVYSAFFKLGFDGKNCLEQAMEGTINHFPESFDANKRVTALSLPENGILVAEQPIRFILKSDEAIDIAVINNGQWTHLKKEGNVFTADISPQQGTLGLYSKFDSEKPSFDGLLKYDVK